MKQTVVCELTSFQTWIQSNKLTINYDPRKSSYCIFKPKNKILPYTYNQEIIIGRNKLFDKDSKKYLELILDDKLTWKDHITEINNKIIKYTGIFCKIRHLLPEECRFALYNSFVFSRLNYGIA